MENFIVSARKYRPQTFESVVGQKHITGTLKNAIRNKQLAQAFLFCGPRGVGKTTCARIFAKVINCQNPGPDMEPCNECESCTSFNNNASFNIHELDAASNNSVDDIRNLVEQVRIPPQVGEYKVYIIDEVHMLSQAAFNAFLKTLEEPPAYAKFILATTEKHKIIPTILSRCQIFDFKRITIGDIAGHLAWVAEKEGVTAQKDALHIIAQKADGAMRDALSIFDQLVSFSGNHVTYDTVIENLNVLDYDYYFRMTESLMNGNIKNALLILNDIISNGFDGQHFLMGFGAHLRNLLISRDPQTYPLLEESESIAIRYKQQAALCSEHFLIESLKKQNQADVQYKSSNNKRLLLELLLIESALSGGNMTVSGVPSSSAPAEQKKKDDTPTVIPETIKTDSSNTTVNAGRNTAARAEQSQPPQNESASTTDDAVVIPEKKLGSAPNGLRKRKSTISIKTEEQTAIQRDREARNRREALKNMAEPVDEQHMKDCWMQWADKYHDVDPLLYSAMTTYPVKMGDDDTIIMTIENKVQENTIQKNQDKLMEFLRQKLNNSKLSLQIVITEEKREVKAYTVEDRFREMVSKNPQLAELKSRLGLHLEY